MFCHCNRLSREYIQYITFVLVVLNGSFRGIFVPPICTGGNRVCIELMTTVFGPTSLVGVDGACLGIRRRKIIGRIV